MRTPATVIPSAVTSAGSSLIRPTKRATNGVGRRGVDLAWRAQLLEAAVRHHADPIGDRQRLLLVVGDEQRRHAELQLEAADLLAEVDAHLGVERRQRLVEEQHGRLDHEGRARATRCCWPPESWCG